MTRTDSNYDVNANTKAYYKLNETSGTSVADISGNSNTGTASNVSWVAGKFGNAGSFNGSSSYITCPYLNLATGTISVWVYYNSLSTWPASICSNQNSDWSNNWRVRGVESDWTVSCLWWYDTTIRTAAGLITTWKWYNIVWTQNGTQMKIYINWVLQTLVTNTTPTARLQVNSANQLVIWAIHRWSQFYNQLNGLQDETIVEDTAWTAEQVLNYYNKSQYRYLWEYLWAWPTVTKWLYHLNWDANDSSWNWYYWTATANITFPAWKIGSNCAYSPWWATDRIQMTWAWAWITNVITLAWWINVAGNSWTSDHPWVIMYYAKANGWMYVIWFNQTNTQVQFSKLRETISWHDAVYTFNPVWTWNRYVLTCNWANLKWYINWRLVTSITTAATANGTDNAWTPDWLSLFSRNYVPSGTYKNQTNAYADEVIVENIERTAQQVMKDYTYSKWRFIQ